MQTTDTWLLPIEQTVLQSILKVKKPSVGHYSMSISQNATAHRIWMNRSLLVIGQRFLSVSVDLVVGMTSLWQLEMFGLTMLMCSTLAL